jgi:predicted HicB family RNase H-like nuclease
MSDPTTENDKWKSLRIKPQNHRRFKELAARKGMSLDEAAGYALDKASETEAVAAGERRDAPHTDRPAD